MHPISVTNHCIVRFLERVDGYDFTDLKLEYMLEKSIPSMRYIKDGEFVRWISARLDVTPFRERILSFIEPFMTEGIWNNIKQSPRREQVVFADRFKFIICDRKVITVLDKREDDLQSA